MRSLSRCLLRLVAVLCGVAGPVRPLMLLLRWVFRAVCVEVGEPLSAVRRAGSTPQRIHGRVDAGWWGVAGRGARQRSDRIEARSKKCGSRTGYVYLHSAVDDFSRLAYTEALPDEKATITIGFVHRARVFFADHGITHTERRVPHNGAC